MNRSSTTCTTPGAALAPRPLLRRLASLSLILAVSACGGSGGGSGPDAQSANPGFSTDGSGREIALDANGLPTSEPYVASGQDQPTTTKDASRLLQQASFGPSADAIDTVARQGVVKYLAGQFNEAPSRYTYTLPANQYRAQVHSDARQNFCVERGFASQDDCWRDWFSSVPVEWDFYRQAVHGHDQLRQRVAFTLGQIFVASGKELEGTYAFAEYHQMLRDNAFGNFRSLLERVTLSPFMGTYLNMVDNDGSAPNENYARELLQLFSLGTCLIDTDGRLTGGRCVPAYDNDIVRNYAYALSGWTYPVGGKNPWCSGCNDWRNPPYMRGDMVAVQARHDNQARPLLSGVTAPAGRSARQGLDAVLDSIMAHPNLAPFISRQFIQFLVTSNPSPAYVGRVAAAFNSGRHGDFGSGTKGDMRAMIAAVLMDGEARDPAAAQAPAFGKLREPVLFVTGAIRALDGRTDGVPLSSYQWGRLLGQPVFNAPSVFNFYPPDYPLPGSDLVAPQFGIENTNTTLARINFANTLVYWWYNAGKGLAASGYTANTTGSQVLFERFETLIRDAQKDSVKAADALNQLLLDGRMTAGELAMVVEAMNVWTPQDTWLTTAERNSSWQRERVKTAAYLMLSSPHYQIQR